MTTLQHHVTGAIERGEAEPIEGIPANRLELSIPTARALLQFAPKNDARFYLSGVSVDFNTGRLEATNGHILLRCFADDSTGDGNVIIPRDSLESVSKGGKQPDPIRIELENGRLTLHRYNGITVTANPIDGKYPDTSRVVPSEVSGELGHYNAQYLATCQKALQDIAGQKSAIPHLAHNGTSAAIMSLADCEAFCVIMPVRHCKPAEFVRYSVTEAA